MRCKWHCRHILSKICTYGHCAYLPLTIREDAEVAAWTSHFHFCSPVLLKKKKKHRNLDYLLSKVPFCLSIFINLRQILAKEM